MCEVLCFLLRAVLNILVRNASPRGPKCFRCLVFSLSVPCELCFPVNGSVCFVCCVFDGVAELLGETNRNMFACVCYFVVECDGVVVCGWRCSFG